MFFAGIAHLPAKMASMFGFVFFVTFFLIGEYFSTRFSLPIPGSMIGLCLALAFLAVRGRVDAPLRESSGKFLRYLPLMLVPVGVGIAAGPSPALQANAGQSSAVQVNASQPAASEPVD